MGNESKGEEMSGYQWFVEAPGSGNEIVARMLDQRQVADEACISV